MLLSDSLNKTKMTTHDTYPLAAPERGPSQEEIVVNMGRRATTLAAETAEMPAAVDGLIAAIQEIPLDDFKVHRAMEDQLSPIATGLEQLGILAEQLQDEELRTRIGEMQHTSTEDLEARLAEMPFFSPDELPTKRREHHIYWPRGSVFHIDPAKITGATHFTDWRGRPPENSKDREMYSSSVIVDYARRPTALPPLESDALCMVIDKDGQVSYFCATSTHRAAAAKLRGEPMAFNGLRVFDYREN